MDSGRLIEELLVAVKRAEKEAAPATAEGTGNDAGDTSSAPDCESQQHTPQRRR